MYPKYFLNILTRGRKNVAQPNHRPTTYDIDYDDDDDSEDETSTSNTTYKSHVSPPNATTSATLKTDDNAKSMFSLSQKQHSVSNEAVSPLHRKKDDSKENNTAAIQPSLLETPTSVFSFFGKKKADSVSSILSNPAASVAATDTAEQQYLTGEEYKQEYKLLIARCLYILYNNTSYLNDITMQYSLVDITPMSLNLVQGYMSPLPVNSKFRDTRNKSSKTLELEDLTRILQQKVLNMQVPEVLQDTDCFFLKMMQKHSSFTSVDKVVQFFDTSRIDLYLFLYMYNKVHRKDDVMENLEEVHTSIALRMFNDLVMQLAQSKKLLARQTKIENIVSTVPQDWVRAIQESSKPGGILEIHRILQQNILNNVLNAKGENQRAKTFETMSNVSSFMRTYLDSRTQGQLDRNLSTEKEAWDMLFSDLKDCQSELKMTKNRVKPLDDATRLFQEMIRDLVKVDSEYTSKNKQIPYELASNVYKKIEEWLHVRSKEKSISDYEFEMNSLKHKMFHLETKVSVMKDMEKLIGELSSGNQAFAIQNKHLMDQLATVNRQLLQSKQVEKTLEEAIHQASLVNKNITDANQRLKQQKEQISQKMSQQIDIITKQLNTLKTELESKEQQNARQETQIKSMERTNITLNQDLQAKKRAVETLEDDLTYWKQKHDEMESNYGTFSAKVKADIEKLETKQKKLLEENKKLESINTKQSKALDHKTEAIDKLQTERNALKDEKEKVQQELKTATSKYDSLDKEFEQLKDVKQKLEIDYQRIQILCQSQLTEIELQLAQITSKNTTIQKLEETISERTTSFQASLKQINQEKKDEKARFQEELKKMEDQSNEALKKEKQSSEESLNKVLRQEKEKSEAQQKQSISVLNAEKQKYQELYDICQTKMTELKEKEDQLVQLNKEKVEHQAQIDDQKANIQQLSNTIKLYFYKVEDFNKTISNYDAINYTLNKNIQELTDKTVELQNHLQNQSAKHKQAIEEHTAKQATLQDNIKRLEKDNTELTNSKMNLENVLRDTKLKLREVQGELTSLSVQFRTLQTENESAMENNNILSYNNEALGQQLIDTKTENNLMNQQNKTLLTQIRQKEEKITDLQRDYEQLKDQLEGSTYLNAEQKQQIQELMSVREQKQNEHDGLVRKVDSLENELKQVRETSQLTQSSLSNAMSELKLNLQEIQKLQTQNQFLHTSMERLVEENKTLSAKIQKQVEKIDQLEEQNKVDTQIHHDKHKLFDRETSEQKAEIDNLHASKDGLTKKIQELEQQLQTMKNEKDALINSNSELQNNNEEQLTKIQTLENQIAGLRSQLENSNNTLTNAKEENSRLTRNNETLTTKNAEQKKHLESLQVLRKSLEALNESAKNENQDLEKHNALLKSTNVALQQQIEDLTQNTKTQSETLTSQKSTINYLQSSINALSAQVTDYQNENRQMMQNLKTNEEEKKQLQQSLSDRIRQIEEKEDIIQELSDKLKSSIYQQTNTQQLLEKASQEINIQREDLQMEITALKLCNEELSEHNKEMSTHFQSALDQLKSYQTELHSKIINLETQNIHVNNENLSLRNDIATYNKNVKELQEQLAQEQEKNRKLQQQVGVQSVDSVPPLPPSPEDEAFYEIVKQFEQITNLPESESVLQRNQTRLQQIATRNDEMVETLKSVLNSALNTNNDDDHFVTQVMQQLSFFKLEMFEKMHKMRTKGKLILLNADSSFQKQHGSQFNDPSRLLERFEKDGGKELAQLSISDLRNYYALCNAELSNEENFKTNRHGINIRTSHSAASWENMVNNVIKLTKLHALLSSEIFQRYTAAVDEINAKEEQLKSMQSKNAEIARMLQDFVENENNSIRGQQATRIKRYIEDSNNTESSQDLLRDIHSIIQTQWPNYEKLIKNIGKDEKAAYNKYCEALTSLYENVKKVIEFYKRKNVSFHNEELQTILNTMEEHLQKCQQYHTSNYSTQEFGNLKKVLQTVSKQVNDIYSKTEGTVYRNIWKKYLQNIQHFFGTIDDDTSVSNSPVHPDTIQANLNNYIYRELAKVPEEHQQTKNEVLEFHNTVFQYVFNGWLHSRLSAKDELSKNFPKLKEFFEQYIEIPSVITPTQFNEVVTVFHSVVLNKEKDTYNEVTKDNLKDFVFRFTIMFEIDEHQHELQWESMFSEYRREVAQHIKNYLQLYAVPSFSVDFAHYLVEIKDEAQTIFIDTMFNKYQTYKNLLVNLVKEGVMIDSGDLSYTSFEEFPAILDYFCNLHRIMNIEGLANWSSSVILKENYSINFSTMKKMLEISMWIHWFPREDVSLSMSEQDQEMIRRFYSSTTKMNIPQKRIVFMFIYYRLVLDVIIRLRKLILQTDGFKFKYVGLLYMLTVNIFKFWDEEEYLKSTPNNTSFGVNIGTIILDTLHFYGKSTIIFNRETFTALANQLYIIGEGNDFKSDSSQEHLNVEFFKNQVNTLLNNSEIFNYYDRNKTPARRTIRNNPQTFEKKSVQKLSSVCATWFTQIKNLLDPNTETFDISEYKQTTSKLQEVLATFVNQPAPAPHLLLNQKTNIPNITATNTNISRKWSGGRKPNFSSKRRKLGQDVSEKHSTLTKRRRKVVY